MRVGNILAAFKKFIHACSNKFAIKAVYLEVNGFDINPDRWYFDLFGYAQYAADPDNLGHRAEFQEPLFGLLRAVLGPEPFSRCLRRLASGISN